MIIQRGPIEIAANTLVPNLLQTLGVRLRQLPNRWGATGIVLLASAELTGLEVGFFVGSDQPLEASAPAITNRIPIKPDDLLMDAVTAWGGDQLQLQVNNTTGAIIDFFFTLEARQLSAVERSSRRL